MANEACIGYFGYGSLVNVDTLRTPYISAHRARLTGWQRVWLQRPNTDELGFSSPDNSAFLSVQEAPNQVIDGLIVLDKKSSLEALDLREAFYERVEIGFDTVQFLDDEELDRHIPLYLYVSRLPKAGPGALILRSYLDAVMQGFYHQFGAKGVKDFMKTTQGFDTPLHEDRHAPLYPRSVVLKEQEKALFESHKPLEC